MRASKQRGPDMAKRDNIRRALDAAREGRTCRTWGHEWRETQGLGKLLGAHECARCGEYRGGAMPSPAAGALGRISQKPVDWWRSLEGDRAGLDVADDLLPSSAADYRAQAARAILDRAFGGGNA
mgnify:CR=1 FL=1